MRCSWSQLTCEFGGINRRVWSWSHVTCALGGVWGGHGGGVDGHSLLVSQVLQDEEQNGHADCREEDDKEAAGVLQPILHRASGQEIAAMGLSQVLLVQLLQEAALRVAQDLVRQRHLYGKTTTVLQLRILSDSATCIGQKQVSYSSGSCPIAPPAWDKNKFPTAQDLVR